MATKYLTLTGLSYFYGRLKTLFVAKETGKGLSTNDLTDALVTQINESEANVIETVKLNGKALTVTDKAVNVTAPVQSVTMNGTALTPDSSGAVAVGIGLQGSLIPADEYGDIWIPAPRLAWGGDNDPYRMTLYGNQDSISFNNHANGISVSVDREHSDSPQTVSYDKVLPDETRVNALIAAAVGNVTGIRYLPVDALPATGEAGVIYLVPNSGSAPNIKDEYIWFNKGTEETPDYAFEKIGTTEVNLTNYLQTTDIEAITTAEIDEITAA